MVIGAGSNLFRGRDVPSVGIFSLQPRQRPHPKRFPEYWIMRDIQIEMLHPFTKKSDDHVVIGWNTRRETVPGSACQCMELENRDERVAKEFLRRINSLWERSIKLCNFTEAFGRVAPEPELHLAQHQHSVAYCAQNMPVLVTLAIKPFAAGDEPRLGPQGLDLRSYCLEADVSAFNRR